MKVSIVIPHFNRADLLAQAIGSVRAQTDGNWELIVVDDGSEPEQWERTRAMADPQIRVFQRRDGIKGPSRCRNLGLKAATGEYVLFLDSDDCLAPWCLTQRLDAATAQPDADLWVFPALLFDTQPGDSDLLWNVLESPHTDLARFLQSDPPWHTSSPLWRREKLLALGGFNEAVCYGDDSDLHTRALLDGAKVRKIAQALPDVFIRRSDEVRITNSLTSALVESRRIRLVEGTRVLKEKGARRDLFQLWEGQYFVEAEFLLFNVDDSRAAIYRVLLDWEAAFQPSWRRRVAVRAYLAVALACRRRAYLVLRVARRLAMKLLPATFFPRGGGFQSAYLEAKVLQAVRSGMAAGRKS